MSTTECPKLPSYTELRKDKLDKIDKYFGEVLTNYSGLATSSASNVSNLIASYNNQLKTINNELINQLNTSLDGLAEQHATLKQKQELYDTNTTLLKNLKQAIKDKTVEESAKAKNASETTQVVDNTKLWHYIFMGVNIALLLINIGLLVYLYMVSAQSALPKLPRSINSNK